MDLQEIAIKNFRFTNWSRTYECQPKLYFVPQTIEQIREILFLAKSERNRIRVIGCGNSPSDICCSNDYMLDLVHFNRVLHIDRETSLVTVQGGCTLGELNRVLEQNELALPVLGSISDSTLAAVISVGTHGTGYDTGIIADYVTELRVILSSGDVVVCNRTTNSEIFLATLCGLGALGIILEVTIQCRPKFYLHQLTYGSTLESVLANLDEQVESCDHFRFLWFPHTPYVSISITNRLNGRFLKLDQSEGDQEDGESDPLLSVAQMYHVPLKLDSEKLWWQKALDWMVSYGIGYHVLQFAYWLSTYWPAMVPTINRVAFWLLYSDTKISLDISYKIFNFECLFDQYVNEWCIPRNKTAEVLLELEKIIKSSESMYAHFPVEVRFARSSDIYLAPNYGRDSTFINIICYRPYGKVVDHGQYWQAYERIVKQAGGRPHWAKQHNERADDFVRMYPYFRAWMGLRKRFDPNGMLCNAYLDRILGSMSTQEKEAAKKVFKRDTSPEIDIISLDSDNKSGEEIEVDEDDDDEEEEEEEEEEDLASFN